MTLFKNHITKTNRKESFWFHMIRGINFFCYRFWWLVLLIFIGLIVLFYFKCYKNDTSKKILSQQGLQPPRENCRVFFTGLVVGGSAEAYNISKIYELDEASEFVGAGDYPDNTKAFPNSVRQTFDGIAIDAQTRLTIYSQKNFKGEILLDTVGPIIINNVLWKNDTRYNHCNTDDFPEALQKTYPQSKRIWSKSDMHDWSFGSCKITCN
jgi:hypothetical protein